MKFKKTALATLIAGGLLSSGMAMADSAFTGNLGLTSNYIWRGFTQTNDQAAISGGLDYALPADLYIGAWTSNVTWGGDGTELDTYAGWAPTFGDVGLDIGVVNYAYPQYGKASNNSDTSFYEAYVGASWMGLSGKVSYSPNADMALDRTEDNPTVYVEAAYDLELPSKTSLSFHVGNYSAKNAFFADYDTGKLEKSSTDYSVSLSKDDFVFAVSNTTLKGDTPRFAVSYSKSFDL
ncbi:MAG: TorF family putative porin [Gammaproteobacteria bacterium]|jgi:uncharacterized protein (TIGR02001 family)